MSGPPSPALYGSSPRRQQERQGTPARAPCGRARPAEPARSLLHPAGVGELARVLTGVWRDAEEAHHCSQAEAGGPGAKVLGLGRGGVRVAQGQLAHIRHEGGPEGRVQAARQLRRQRVGPVVEPDDARAAAGGAQELHAHAELVLLREPGMTEGSALAGEAGHLVQGSGGDGCKPAVRRGTQAAAERRQPQPVQRRPPLHAPWTTDQHWNPTARRKAASGRVGVNALPTRAPRTWKAMVAGPRSPLHLRNCWRGTRLSRRAAGAGSALGNGCGRLQACRRLVYDAQGDQVVAQGRQVASAPFAMRRRHYTWHGPVALQRPLGTQPMRPHSLHCTHMPSWGCPPSAHGGVLAQLSRGEGQLVAQRPHRVAARPKHAHLRAGRQGCEFTCEAPA